MKKRNDHKPTNRTQLIEYITQELQPKETYSKKLNKFLREIAKIKTIQEMLDTPQGCIDILRCLYFSARLESDSNETYQTLNQQYRRLDGLFEKTISEEKREKLSKTLLKFVASAEEFVESSPRNLLTNELYNRVDHRLNDEIFPYFEREGKDISLAEENYEKHGDEISKANSEVEEIEMFKSRMETRAKRMNIHKSRGDYSSKPFVSEETFGEYIPEVRVY